MPQPPNLQKMLAEAQAMLAQQQEAQEALKDEKVDASTGGGSVKIVMTGDLRVESLVIDPDAVDPEDVEMLQDLIIAAVNEVDPQGRGAPAEPPRPPRGTGRVRPDERAESLGLGGMGGIGGGGVAAAFRAACLRAAAARNRAARRTEKRKYACSPRPFSGSSPSSRSCRGSATAPPSGSRSTCSGYRRRTRSRWPRRSAT